VQRNWGGWFWGFWGSFPMSVLWSRALLAHNGSCHVVHAPSARWALRTCQCALSLHLPQCCDRELAQMDEWGETQGHLIWDFSEVHKVKEKKELSTVVLKVGAKKHSVMHQPELPWSVWAGGGKGMEVENEDQGTEGNSSWVRVSELNPISERFLCADRARCLLTEIRILFFPALWHTGQINATS
jgi:hypothetical protein